jgi:hypothetical protein
MNMDSSKTYKYTSFLKLLEYQLFNAGFIQNLIVWDVPNAKSVFHFNVGLAYGRTAMRDSVLVTNDKETILTVNNFGVNTLHITPQLSWEIKPEERYGFVITERFLALAAFSENLRFVNNTHTISNEHFLELSSLEHLKGKPKTFGFINTIEFFGFFRPIHNQDQKLFFRYRLNNDLTNFKFGFHQIQLGYTINITSK